MIWSIVAGSLSKIVGDFIEVRKKKAEHKIEQERIQLDHQNALDLARQSHEFGLEVEMQRTHQAHFAAIKSQIKAQSDMIAKIHENDKVLFSKVDKWILNLIALMKPFITYIICISYFMLIFCVSFKGINDKLLTGLTKVGYFEVVDGVIGFWFGFYGVSKIKKT